MFKKVLKGTISRAILYGIAISLLVAVALSTVGFKTYTTEGYPWSEVVARSAWNRISCPTYLTRQGDGNVNVRSGPSLDNAVRFSLPKGSCVRSTDSEAGWIQITHDKGKGWVRYDLIIGE